MVFPIRLFIFQQVGFFNRVVYISAGRNTMYDTMKAAVKQDISSLNCADSFVNMTIVVKYSRWKNQHKEKPACLHLSSPVQQYFTFIPGAFFSWVCLAEVKWF